jgi:hypothetical protein
MTPEIPAKPTGDEAKIKLQRLVFALFEQTTDRGAHHIVQALDALIEVRVREALTEFYKQLQREGKL